MNVVRVAVRIARISEYPRHLTCGELICLLDGHDGNDSALALASDDGAGQRDANRNPHTVYSSHWAAPYTLHVSRRNFIPSKHFDDPGMRREDAQIGTLMYFTTTGTRLRSHGPDVDDQSLDSLGTGGLVLRQG
jgi:hypothetical protein